MGHSLPVSDGTPEARERAAQHLRRQAELTASALYAAILVAAADDAGAGGPCWQVLQGHERDPFSTALALKFLGGVHRLVLEGKAPELAPFYPSVGGDANKGDPFPAFVTTVQQHIGELQKSLDLGVQTNEVGRSAALLPGFLAVANRWRLPLRIRELGTSAGLNLRWDHFRYERNGRGWGDPDSLVRFGDEVFETDAPFDIGATVVDRRGCDRAPLDATTDEGRMRLMSYVWPDQPERFHLLENAIEIARRVPAAVDEADAIEWASAQLEHAEPGTATVMFHSIFIQYLKPADRVALEGLIVAAGRRATEDAPLAYLHMEPGEALARVLLTQWPGGTHQVVSEAGYHGRPVRVTQRA
jgi:hypothetical protein